MRRIPAEMTIEPYPVNPVLETQHELLNHAHLLLFGTIYSDGPDLELPGPEDLDAHGDMKGMTLDEWQAWTNDLIQEVKDNNKLQE